MSLFLLYISGASMFGLLACQSVPPASRSAKQIVVAPPPTPAPTPAPTKDDATVEKILDAMEEQGRTMKDFTASATMEKFEALTDEREVRRGRVVVLGPTGKDREIGIVFDELIDSTGRGSTDARRFVFRGGWMSEFDPTKKQVIRRQLAPEGESFDPLRVGEGPFPVPLGQPKKDVVREFIVTMGTLPDAPFFRSLATVPPAAGSAGAAGVTVSATESPLVILRLVPRVGTKMARDTAAMSIILDRTSLIPRGVEVEAVNGDKTRVLLRDGRLNVGLDDAARAILSPPSTDGWKIDTRPLNP